MATTKIQTGGVTAQSITHDKLHTDMNLSTKTVVLPTMSSDITLSSTPYPRLHITDTVGVPRQFSVGVDNERFKIRNETGSFNAFVIDNVNRVALGHDSPTSVLDVKGEIELRDITGNLAHGMSVFSDTDVYAIIAQESSGDGGLRITSLSDATTAASAFQINAVATTPSTDGNNAAIRLRTAKKNGTTEQALAADEDVLSIGNVGTELVVVKGDGDVGIGTSSPSYPLHIYGTGHKRLKIEKTDSGGDADLQLSSPNDSTQWILFHDRTSGNNSGVIKYVHSTNKMHFRTNDVDDRLVISDDGNVGIGTNGPEYPLQVSGSNVLSGGGLATFGIYDNGTAYNGTNPGGGVTFRGKYTSANAITNFATVQGIKENAIDGNYDTALRFTTRSNSANLTEKVRISSGGNVGIGTDDPLAKLHVQGNAVIGNIQPYETTNAANSGATLHVHNLADDGADTDGKVNFGDETQVIISTGAIDGGPQGYQGSLWFGTSDHPAGGSATNSSGTQFNWKVAGIASKTDQDTGGQNTSYGNLEFYTKGLNNTPDAALAMTIDESQNVGIGTTPASGRKLDVAGDIATTGIIHQDADNTGSVALGFEALNGNVSGNWSVAIGRQALDAALTGDFNVAIGRTSMTNMVSGTQNVAIGVDSMEAKTAGSYNVAIGASALRVNALIGDNNVAIGAQAGRNVRGANNTLIGHEAGYDITTASNNTYVGRFQGTQHSHSLATESHNVVLSDGVGNIAYRSNTSSLQGTSGTRTHHFATAYEATTSSGWVAGAAAYTWHRITDINFNVAPWQTSLIPLMRIGLTFASLNPSYGYVGKAYIDVMNTGANTSYTGNSNFQTMSNGVASYELPVNIATHTGTTSLEFRARMVLTGTQKNLEVYCNAAQNSSYPVTMTIQLFHSITN